MDLQRSVNCATRVGSPWRAVSRGAAGSSGLRRARAPARAAARGRWRSRRDAPRRGGPAWRRNACGWADRPSSGDPFVQRRLAHGLARGAERGDDRVAQRTSRWGSVPALRPPSCQAQRLEPVHHLAGVANVPARVHQLVQRGGVDHGRHSASSPAARAGGGPRPRRASRCAARGSTRPRASVHARPDPSRTRWLNTRPCEESRTACMRSGEIDEPVDEAGGSWPAGSRAGSWRRAGSRARPRSG